MFGISICVCRAGTDVGDLLKWWQCKETCGKREGKTKVKSKWSIRVNQLSQLKSWPRKSSGSGEGERPREVASGEDVYHAVRLNANWTLCLYAMSLFRSSTLCFLASKLHHSENQGIRCDAEQCCNSSLKQCISKWVDITERIKTHISPCVVLLLDIKGLRVVCTSRILAEGACASGVWV